MKKFATVLATVLMPLSFVPAANAWTLDPVLPAEIYVELGPITTAGLAVSQAPVVANVAYDAAQATGGQGEIYRALATVGEAPNILDEFADPGLCYNSYVRPFSNNGIWVQSTNNKCYNRGLPVIEID